MMALRTITTSEKLYEIEQMITETRHDERRQDVLKAIAKDVRARLNGAPSVVLHKMEERINQVARSKEPNGDSMRYGAGQLLALGNEVVGRWPVIKIALELFGAEVEK